LIGAGFGVLFFSVFFSTDFFSCGDSDFWQDPEVGFVGVTTGVVGVVGVVVPVPVPPPVKTAADRVAAAKRTAV
jgi:hypothetical protein